MTANNDELSGSDSDDGFDEDMEALRRACILTGTNPEDLQPSSAITLSTYTDSTDEDDDLELVRNIQRRFSDIDQPLYLEPLSSLRPGDDCEDDFETLRAIQRRFTDYKDNLENNTEESLHEPKQVGATSIASEKETSNNLFVDRTNVGEGFPDSVDASIVTQNTELVNHYDPETQPSGLIEWHESGIENIATSPVRDSGFPKSAQAFIDAIKKNRSCQKFLRSKLIQVEARIEENKKLRERVKILKDFQVSCRKRTGQALSQKRDARVQLISVSKLRPSSKANEKKVPATYYGPAENSHVANYRTVLEKFPVSLSREKWSKEEKENLAKGIKQQFQENLLQKSVDLFSDAERQAGDSNDFDSIIVSIRDLEITPENIRLFLPKVNWEQLASMYATGRSGAECEARWLNFEDPLINQQPWTMMEDKNLLHIVQQKGINNWIDIAVSMGTNRTPFQCLARYQRSLNASIMKREWTEDEDDKLRSAVATIGESNWQLVASKLEGRTGTQCSNRWKKTLHPTRQRVGKWTNDEDKRLKVAVMLFGAKNWRKIAQFVPGRTQVQCRERWVNCLDPSLKLGEWTEEEDSRLKAAITEHGYCWSKVAACLPPRTDSQCRRRWKVLLPHEVPLLQAAKKMQKVALISNFVDRESERPALGPNDFIPLTMITVPDSENVNPPGKRKRKSRRVPKHNDNVAASGDVPKVRSKRRRKEAQVYSGEVLRLTNGSEVENLDGDVDISRTKQVKRPTSKRKKAAGSTQDLLLPCQDALLVAITNSEEVGPSDGDDARKKKRSPARGKRKLGGTPESKEIDTASGHDIVSKKQRRRKPCSKEIESFDPTHEDVGGFRGDNATLIRKASKLRPRKRSTGSGAHVEVQGDTNFNEVEVFSGNDAILTEERRGNPSSSFPNSSLMVIDEELFDANGALKNIQPLEPCLETSTTNGDDVEALGGDHSEERPLKCSTPDILDSLNLRPSDVCRKSKPKEPRTKDRSCSNPTSEAEDGYDMTLASFLQQSGKYKKSSSFSVKVSGLHLMQGGSSKIAEGSQNISLHLNCSTSGTPEDQQQN